MQLITNHELCKNTIDAVLNSYSTYTCVMRGFGSNSLSYYRDKNTHNLELNTIREEDEEFCRSIVNGNDKRIFIICSESEVDGILLLTKYLPNDVEFIIYVEDDNIAKQRIYAEIDSEYQKEDAAMAIREHFDISEEEYNDVSLISIKDNALFRGAVMVLKENIDYLIDRFNHYCDRENGDYYSWQAAVESAMEEFDDKIIYAAVSLLVDELFKNEKDTDAYNAAVCKICDTWNDLEDEDGEYVCEYSSNEAKNEALTNLVVKTLNRNFAE